MRRGLRKQRQAQLASRPATINREFWQTPTGRVATGVGVLAALAVIVGLTQNTRQTTEAPSSLDRVAMSGDAHKLAAPHPEPAIVDRRIDSAPPPQNVKKLSRDPAARVPQSPAWLKNAIAATPPEDRPMIAVVIDDVGLDRPRSRRAMALPAPVTIALMAYAGEAPAQAATARRAGHELIVHLPMEPGEAGEDPGPNALLSGLTDTEFERRLDWNLSQFAGYVGINNHMGSKLTSDPAALAPVMAALKRRGLMYLDSRTTSDTKGLEVARAHGVPAVERDIFIDHDPSPIAVWTALVRAEELAQATGFAIVIGHPRDATLDALEEWLPDVKRRGFAVVPLTTIVHYAVTDG